MTFYEIVDWLTLFSPCVLCIGIVIGYFYYSSLDKVHKSITWYLLVMLFVDIASRIFKHSNNNLIILLFYSALELGMFNFFYYKYLYKSKHKTILILNCIGILYIFWEIIMFKKIDAKEFQSYAKVVDDFMIIILVLTFFYEKINVFKESLWENFRLNTVILIFFSVNLLFFLPYNFIINKSAGFQFYFWLGIIIITVSFYLYLTHCIWKNGRTRRLLPSGSR